MGAAVVLREDFGADELRRLAAKVKDAAQARRLLALAAVRDGMNRTEAARIGGMERATVEALRRAERGIEAACRDRPRPGEGWGRTLALRRPEACSRTALRCRSVGGEPGARAQEARLLAHQRPAAPSRAGSGGDRGI